MIIVLLFVKQILLKSDQVRPTFRISHNIFVKGTFKLNITTPLKLFKKSNF